MGNTILVVDSITSAMKGRKILSINGIRSEVKRIPGIGKNNSCGYGLYIFERVDDAKELLNSNKIRVKDHKP